MSKISPKLLNLISNQKSHQNSNIKVYYVNQKPFKFNPDFLILLIMVYFFKFIKIIKPNPINYEFSWKEQKKIDEKPFKKEVKKNSRWFGSHALYNSHVRSVKDMKN